MVLRTKPEKKEEKDRTREELLRAALRLGATHGFASLGLREVAREALIAPTSFYRHFEDMQALGLAIVRDKVEPFLREWVEAPTDPQLDPAPETDAPVVASANAIASACVESLLQAVDGDPELARFIVAERVGSSAALRAALRTACGAPAQSLLRTLAIQRRSRAVLDAADLVTVLLLEAAAQLLDIDAAGRAALRQRSVQRIESAITAMSTLDRKA
jgi:TetR/AcrR family transcriptional regulator, fatty acid biosynthesis regulator